MRQVTKAIFSMCWGYRLTIVCIRKGPGQFCEMSAIVANYVTDTPRWFCDGLRKVDGC